MRFGTFVSCINPLEGMENESLGFNKSYLG